MTISLVVFVSLQFYWLKEYYTALEQDFSNKVYTALENSSKKIEELEIQKYNEKFKNFDKTLANNAKSPTLFQIQQTQEFRQILEYLYDRLKKSEFLLFRL